MKIILLANANSIHTQRWAKGLAERGINIFVFSLSKTDSNTFKGIDNIELYSFGFSENFTKNNEGSLAKLQYLKVLPVLRKKIKSFNPDILHAHYISGYGTLGALSGFHPLIISVWGSDIFEFPQKSFFHKKLIEYNLKRADEILSTSDTMAIETKKYTNKNIKITPFGINLNKFKPMSVDSLFDKDDIVIGTVKALEKTYGVEYLIRAFAVLHKKLNKLPLRLLIVGKGTQEEYLKQLVIDLKIVEQTKFTGKITYDKIPQYHNMCTISIYPSINESFGVSVIESSACEKPVIVSNVGGLPEVVENGVTGIVVPPKNSLELSKAIEKLVLDKELRVQMGKAGRDRVQKMYNWENNVSTMVDIYRDVVK